MLTLLSSRKCLIGTIVPLQSPSFSLLITQLSEWILPQLASGSLLVSYTSVFTYYFREWCDPIAWLICALTTSANTYCFLSSTAIVFFATNEHKTVSLLWILMYTTLYYDHPFQNSPLCANYSVKMYNHMDTKLMKSPLFFYRQLKKNFMIFPYKLCTFTIFHYSVSEYCPVSLDLLHLVSFSTTLPIMIIDSTPIAVK